jgi:hypothetical protein
MHSHPKPRLVGPNTRTSKIRTSIIALIAAFSVAGLAAVPADASRNICVLLPGGSAIVCHHAMGCKVEYKQDNGSVLTVTYEDGTEETIGGQKYKCNDGTWELAAEGGGSPSPFHPPGERPSGEPPKMLAP